MGFLVGKMVVGIFALGLSLAFTYISLHVWHLLFIVRIKYIKNSFCQIIRKYMVYGCLKRLGALIKEGTNAFSAVVLYLIYCALGQQTFMGSKMVLICVIVFEILAYSHSGQFEKKAPEQAKVVEKKQKKDVEEGKFEEYADYGTTEKKGA